MNFDHISLCVMTHPPTIPEMWRGAIGLGVRGEKNMPSFPACGLPRGNQWAIVDQKILDLNGFRGLIQQGFGYAWSGIALKAKLHVHEAKQNHHRQQTNPAFYSTFLWIAWINKKVYDTAIVYRCFFYSLALGTMGKICVVYCLHVTGFR